MNASLSHTTHDPFAALRIPFVRSFALGRMAAIIGSQILSVAVGWQLYERTHDPWSLGLVGLFELIPVFVLMLPAGIIIDRVARRNVAIFAHSLLALISLGLMFASWAHASVHAIYALLVGVGVARAFASPSVGTLLPQLLKVDQLANANAWLSSSYELASIGGPALGGLLIAIFKNATWAYLVATLGQLVFVALLSRFPSQTPHPSSHTSQTLSEMFAGLAFIRRNPVFLAAITLDLFAVLFGGAVALMPVFAKNILHVGALGLGCLRAAPAVGAMTMAFVITRIPPFKRPGLVLSWAVVGFGVATIGFGLSRHSSLSLICLFCVGLFDAISVVIRMTLMQMMTPDSVRGRVAAINYVFVGFSNEFGSFESGATAKIFGPIVSVVGGGICTILVVIVVTYLWPALARIGPLHSLRPVESNENEAAT